MTNFARLALLLTAIFAAVIGTAAEKPPQQPTKLEKPQKGMGRYAVVLWEAGTPIPGNNGKHMGKITEPDFAKLGGTVLVTNGNRRLVDLPVKEAEKLKKHNAVASMQRLWMGEPLEELETPAGSSARQFELETDVDTNLDWGPKAYQYDGSGNIRQIGTDSFSYDTAGRLIQSNIGGKVETFKYDAFGNLIEKTVTGANPVTIPVDGESNRIIGGVYDAKGNVLAGNGRKFTYDPLNMLMEDTGNGGRQMVYDADDERIGVIIGTGLSRWWIRDFEGKVIREYQGVGGSEFAWYWEQDWIYGEGQLVGGDRVPFWWQNEEDGRTYTFGGKRHYHLDHLGSVRMVTDSSGRSVSEHDYYAFGVTPTKAYQEQINWGDPHIDAMRFAGHQREFLGFINTENTDYLDYMHARYYDPNLGRFLSVDPIMSADRKYPQSWNKYSYALNNPLRFVDPTGMYVTTCAVGDTKCANEAASFEAARQENLAKKGDQFADIRAAAAAYGDPGQVNGVVVSFVDKVTDSKGKVLSANASVIADLVTGSGVTGQYNVQIKKGLTGTTLGNAVAHEGRHVQDAQSFVATLAAGTVTSSMRLYQTEMNAYMVTALYAKSANATIKYEGMTIGPNMPKEQLRIAIDTFLKNSGRGPDVKRCQFPAFCE